MSLPNPFWAKPHPDAIDDGDENGVYAITRRTDYWFNRELDQLSRKRSCSPRNGRKRDCHATMSNAPESSSPSRYSG